MDKIETLKPCPFCGSVDIEIVYEVKYQYPFYAYCNNCDVQTGRYGSKQGAVSEWNRRVE